MSGLRPLSLTLRTGHVLTTTADSLNWTCTPALSRPSEGPMPLRDLIERIAHEPGTDAVYGLDAKNGSLFVTYAILDEIRSAHGGDFAWCITAPDHSCTLILDELDEICCESRAWTRGGTVEQLTALASAHHARIGFQEAATASVALPSLRVEQDGTRMFLRGRDTTIEFSNPRGPSQRQIAFATYLASLSLAA